jgi:hypothetical protein
MAIIPADEKVFMVDTRTNTVYGGSQALQDMQQWYTMQDVSDSVQPYKVFTALLTQSGGDDPQTQSSGSVQKGVTYFVDGGTIGLTDFSNVGGEFQTSDTGSYYFIATIDGTPNEYGGATADYNGGAPVATVLENTIGNVWFEFDDGGIYDIRSGSLFIDKKTGIIMAAPYDTLNPGTLGLYKTTIESEDLIRLRVFNVLEAPKNGYLNYTFVEIKVYN